MIIAFENNIPLKKFIYKTHKNICIHYNNYPKITIDESIYFYLRGIKNAGGDHTDIDEYMRRHLPNYIDKEFADMCIYYILDKRLVEINSTSPLFLV